MIRFWCDDEYEHRREARRDFEYRGRYGYDRDRYGDRWDDCNRAYTEEFDRLRRDDDLRREEREDEQRREERAHARRQQEALDYEARQAAYYAEEQMPEPVDEGDA